MAVPPSPKLQLQVTLPTPPVVLAVKIVETPGSEGLGVEAAEETTNAGATIMLWELVAVEPEDVTVSLTVKAPPEV